jgi:hypothetical protein
MLEHESPQVGGTLAKVGPVFAFENEMASVCHWSRCPPNLSRVRLSRGRCYRPLPVAFGPPAVLSCPGDQPHGRCQRQMPNLTRKARGHCVVRWQGNLRGRPLRRRAAPPPCDARALQWPCASLGTAMMARAAARPPATSPAQARSHAGRLVAGLQGPSKSAHATAAPRRFMRLDVGGVQTGS